LHEEFEFVLLQCQFLQFIPAFAIFVSSKLAQYLGVVADIGVVKVTMVPEEEAEELESFEVQVGPEFILRSRWLSYRIDLYKIVHPHFPEKRAGRLELLKDSWIVSQVVEKGLH